MAADKTVRKRGRRTGITYAQNGGNEQWHKIADQIQRLGFIERNNRQYSVVALVALEIAVLNHRGKRRRKGKYDHEIL